MPSASAQIGIKGGMGVSSIVFLKDGMTPYLGYEIGSLGPRKPMMTFEVGTFGTIELWKRIEFQPELLFSMQGLNCNTKYLYDDITYKIHVSYLKMPLLLKYKISTKKKVHSALFVGPYTAWKLKAMRVTEIEGERVKGKIPNIKNTDFGLVTGYSIDFKLFSQQIIFDLRCSYSLINMMDRITGYVPWYYGPSKEYARNINMLCTVGYLLTNIWSKSAAKP
jgi:hypothetical protein